MPPTTRPRYKLSGDIVAKIPGTGTDSHREANEDNKFADIATDPINSFENE